MYEKMLAVAQNSSDPGLKADAQHLLTRFDEPLLVIRTLEYAVSDEVRNQDSWSLIALLLERRETQDLAWQYVVQHWTAVSRKLTVNADVTHRRGGGVVLLGCKARRSGTILYLTSGGVGEDAAKVPGYDKRMHSSAGCTGAGIAPLARRSRRALGLPHSGLKEPIVGGCEARKGQTAPQYPG